MVEARGSTGNNSQKRAGLGTLGPRVQECRLPLTTLSPSQSGCLGWKWMREGWGRRVDERYGAFFLHQDARTRPASQHSSCHPCSGNAFLWPQGNELPHDPLTPLRQGRCSGGAACKTRIPVALTVGVRCRTDHHPKTLRMPLPPWHRLSRKAHSRGCCGLSRACIPKRGESYFQRPGRDACRDGHTALVSDGGEGP